MTRAGRSRGPRTAEAAAADGRGVHAADAALARRFGRYVLPYRKSLVAALVLLFAAGALDLVGPYLTKQAIDHAIPRADASELLRIALLFVGTLVLAFAATYVQNLIMTHAGQAIMRDLRGNLFRHLTRMGLPWFDRNPLGRVVTRVTSDVETLNDLLTAGIVTILADLFTLLGITAILFWMNWQLAALTFLVMPLLVFASILFRRAARRGFDLTRERVARITGVMQEAFSGIEVVKLFGREAENDRQFEEHNAGCRDAWLETVTAFAVFFPLVQLLLALAMATVLWGGGNRVLQNALTFGELVAFLQYVQRFFVPLRDLSEKYNVLQGALAAAERIFGILDTPADEDYERRPELVDVESLGGEIAFENVSFRYNEGEPVLKDVSFRVHPGERIALVGATGAGKTTVLSLLLGLYPLTSGRILLDGRDLATLNPRSVRRRLGTVLQDVFLFSNDVRGNVRLGDPTLDDAAVRSALESARADAIVDALPGGLDEPLGERGRSLSVGQRQLLSFARALARDPDVLLLDEATSSVDSETEGRVQEALETLLEGRTSLVVAHRLSTVRDADRILVFHRGELREEGTHEELLAHGGLYARLVEVQFGGGTVAA
jgi:ATP-binding cassette subfamily B protein